MFGLLIVLALVVGGFSICGLLESRDSIIKGFSCCGLVLALVLFVSAFFTPQGSLYWDQFMATSRTSNWLVIDNSGGETMRHWVIRDGYVESSSASDGWQFYDSDGNGPIYVSGDAFVMKINQPLAEFLKDYKQKYNIPIEQQALR